MEKAKTSKTIYFNIHVSQFDEELHKELVTAQKALEAVQAKVLKAFKESDRARAMKDMSPSYGINHYDPKFRVVDSNISVEVRASMDSDEPRGVAYLDGPLLNTLLHTKLLTDGEKRRLLIQRGILDKPQVDAVDPVALDNGPEEDAPY